VSLLDEEVGCLLQRHLASMHLDANDVASVAQQCVLQLPDA
jgi:hypothetical protein